jgi:hypothetical protein
MIKCKMKYKGGKVIDSGGFGCIFEPSLKCEDNSQNYNQNQISKLMTKKHAEDEYNQIMKYKSILNSIPNYNDYFLLDNFTLCKPNKLTNSDLINYHKKCKSLKKKDIYKNNINQSLDKLMIINMPFGGINVNEFYDKYENQNNLIRLNNSLIRLLTNAIIPMNALNVYHCDIKDTNLLVQPVETDLNVRLIDWGLSFIWTSDKNGIPRHIYRRPFQFNVPFSSVLFNNDFLRLYNDFLILNPVPSYYEIREFVINYIFIWNDIRGSGHLSAINEIFGKLFNDELTAINKEKVKSHIIEYDFTYYYIVEYLSKILNEYTKNGSIDLMTYFEKVFVKNIDIWGFTMVYMTFYEKVYENYDKLNEYQMEFILTIKRIIVRYLYEDPLKPIDVSMLKDELTKMNLIIDKFSINDKSRKHEYYSKMKESIGGFTKNKKKITIKNKRNRRLNYTVRRNK